MSYKKNFRIKIARKKEVLQEEHLRKAKEPNYFLCLPLSSLDIADGSWCTQVYTTFS